MPLPHRWLSAEGSRCKPARPAKGYLGRQAPYKMTHIDMHSAATGASHRFSFFDLARKRNAAFSLLAFLSDPSLFGNGAMLGGFVRQQPGHDGCKSIEAY